MSTFSSPRDMITSPRDLWGSPRRVWQSMTSGDLSRGPGDKDSKKFVASLKRTLGRKPGSLSNEELRAELDAATRRAEELSEQTDVLSDQYEKSKSELKSATEENEKLKEELEEARRKIGESTHYNADLREQLKAAQLWQDKLTKRNEELRAELDRISKEGEGAIRENAELKAEVASLRAIVHETRDKADMLEGELGKAQCKINALRKQSGATRAAGWAPACTSMDSDSGLPSQLAWYARFCGI